MLAPFIDPVTEDYELINGNIANKNAIITLAYTRLQCPRGSWIYDTDFGNPLNTDTLSRTALNRKSLAQQVKLALNDMVTLGYIKELIVVTERIVYAERRVDFAIVMIDNLNDEIKFVWSTQI